MTSLQLFDGEAVAAGRSSRSRWQRLFSARLPSDRLPQQGLRLSVSGNLWRVLSLESVESTESVRASESSVSGDVPLAAEQRRSHCAADESMKV